MHRDKKLGLALALLVIGFAGAFCYRNDQFGLISEAPQLKDSSEINKNIAAGKTKPYLTRSQQERAESAREQNSAMESPAKASHSYFRDNETASAPRSQPADKIAETAPARELYNPNPFGDADDFDDFLNEKSPSRTTTTFEASPKKYNDNKQLPENSGSDRSGDYQVSKTQEMPDRQYHEPDHNQSWEAEPENNSTEIIADSRSNQYSRTEDRPEEPQSTSQVGTYRSSRNTESQFTKFPNLLSEEEVNRTNQVETKSEKSSIAESTSENRSQYSSKNHYKNNNNSSQARLNKSIETDDNKTNYLDEENDPFSESDWDNLSTAKKENNHSNSSVTRNRDTPSYKQKTTQPSYKSSQYKSGNSYKAENQYRQSYANPDNSKSTSSEAQTGSNYQTRLKPRDVAKAIQPETDPQLQAGQMLIHQVRKNETLSGLASRYLGSSRQYMQIYNANRDLLSNPNDIRIGMKLRIPKRGQSGGTQARNVSNKKSQEAKLYHNPKYNTSHYKAKPEVESLPSTDPGTNSNYGSPANKFRPATRSPFQH